MSLKRLILCFIAILGLSTLLVGCVSASLITFDANGGYIIGYAPGATIPSHFSYSQTTFSGSSVTLEKAYRTDYSFDGWYTEKKGGTKVGNAGAKYTPKGSAGLPGYIVYAHWIKKSEEDPTPDKSTTYKITYNANGGSVSPSSVQVIYGNSVILPKPTRMGYTFKGWYTSSTGGSKIGLANSIYQPVSSKTIYAHWTESSNPTYYTITYNANGGTVSPSSAQVTSGNSIKLPTPTRSGYTFNGWYTSSTGGTKVGSAGSSYKPTASVKLYAQWNKESESHTVTFIGNGGTVSPSSAQATSGNSIKLPTPTRSGYTFNGWYTSSTGGTKVGSAGSSYKPTASVKLYAQWNKETESHTVTFIGNGGTVSPSSAQVTSGNSIKLPTPTRSGYTFNGWYTSSTGETKVGAAGSSYKPTASVILYAQWTKADNIYTVTYNANGGVFIPTPIRVTEGNSIYLPSTARSGYKLNGWYTAYSGGVNVGMPGKKYTPAASSVLYAQWSYDYSQDNVQKAPVPQSNQNSENEDLKKKTDELEEKIQTLEERLTKQETLVEVIMKFMKSIFG